MIASSMRPLIAGTKTTDPSAEVVIQIQDETLPNRDHVTIKVGAHGIAWERAAYREKVTTKRIMQSKTAQLAGNRRSRDKPPPEVANHK